MPDDRNQYQIIRKDARNCLSKASMMRLGSDESISLLPPMTSAALPAPARPTTFTSILR